MTENFPKLMIETKSQIQKAGEQNKKPKNLDLGISYMQTMENQKRLLKASRGGEKHLT